MVNVVLVHGVATGAPVARVASDGSTRWSLDVRADGGVVPVVLDGDAAGGADPGSWQEGTPLVILGAVRRRFFRAGGATQSRTEVLAARCVELTRSRTLARALARLGGELSPDAAAALRSLARP
jgi:single-strand DNA-binding protein